MVKDPDLNLSHRHNETTTTCIATLPENNPKTGRAGPSTARGRDKAPLKGVIRGRNVVRNQTL